ncbi:MAG: DMT family transporter [Peptococcaceae bacterium]
MWTNPYVLLTLATLFWGGNFALGKAVSGSIPPMTLSYIRWIEALIFFLPFAWFEFREQRKVLQTNWKAFVALGITGVLGFNMCVYLSVQYTTAINASLINSFAPIVVTLLSIICLQEPVSMRQTSGILISLVGVIWIVAGGNLQQLLSLTFNTGDLIMLFAIVLWGIYNIVLKKQGKLAPPKTIFVGSIIGGLVVTLPLIIYENYYYGLDWITKLSALHYLSLLYFGIFPTIFAFLFFNKAMLEVGPSKASIFLNLVVVFAAFFGILFLNEKLLAAHLVGGILIVAGVVLTARKNPEAKQVGKTNTNDKISI